ncbi:hypothetical protein CDAR_455481, partial [Caerostris darwini]
MKWMSWHAEGERHHLDDFNKDRIISSPDDVHRASDHVIKSVSSQE